VYRLRRPPPTRRSSTVWVGPPLPTGCSSACPAQDGPGMRDGDAGKAGLMARLRRDPRASDPPAV